MTRKKKTETPEIDIMKGLDDRPGFLIRRAHQISLSIFDEECAGLDMTSRQFGVLFVLARAGQLDQISIARLLGLDRSTTGMVVKLLEDRALITRMPDANDGRRHALSLTEAGQQLRKRAIPHVDRARKRLNDALPAKESAMLFKLLEKFTRSFDGATRVPLRRAPKD